MARAADEHERRIRARAHRLWEHDGRPQGRMDEYLERARELQAIEDHPQAGLLPNPIALHHGVIKPAEPVEQAELMENLGEFPGRLTDQGDRSQVPLARKRALSNLRQS